MLMASLLHGELLNFTTIYLNIMPNNIAACLFEPGGRPGLKVNFQFELFCSITHMSNEIGQLCIFECVFLEIGFYTHFKYFSAEEIEGLIQP